MKQTTIKQNVRDCGRIGKAVETSMTERYCKASGKIDWRHLGVAYEIKTGAGELHLSAKGDKIVGCKKVLYIPVPYVETVDGKEVINPEQQEGFILDRAVFLDLLKDVGLFRESKTTTDGKTTAAIQTFWVRKTNKPHSQKKYNALIDALYERCEETLADMIDRESK